MAKQSGYRQDFEDKRKKNGEETYYSSCVFGFDIVSGLLPRLLEALLCHFDPGRKCSSVTLLSKHATLSCFVNIGRLFHRL